MKKFLFIFIGLSGFIAVLMGAAAAHWLQTSLSPERIATIGKASEYQIYHTLALLALASYVPEKFKTASILFCTGIILFSGSLYAHAFTQIHALVYLTPLGGISLIAGWLAIFLHGLRRSN